MTPRSPAPPASPGAAAAAPPAPPRDGVPLGAGGVVSFPRPKSDPGRLGLPLDSVQVQVIEALQEKVGDRYQGWGREAGENHPPFFVDVSGRRYLGATLLQAAAAAARAEDGRAA